MGSICLGTQHARKKSYNPKKRVRKLPNNFFRQQRHISIADPLENDQSIRYFAEDVKNEQHFRAQLKEILIPRVPGTRGSEKVRQVREDTQSRRKKKDIHDFVDVSFDLFSLCLLLQQ